MKPLALRNIEAVKAFNPGLYEDLVTLQNHVNSVTAQLGNLAAPVAEGGISVTALNGVIDVVIFDKHPQQGEDYFLEYDTQASFATAHTVQLGAARNYRTSNLNGLTTFWRWYKDTKLGGQPSNRITFGNPPTGVAAGNLSTVASGPTPGTSQGSGQSQIPGYGYGRPSASASRELRTK